MEFKDLFKQLRLEKGMTQEELAKDMNFSASTISKWESGKKEPNLSSYKIIVLYFKVPAGYLLGLED